MWEVWEALKTIVGTIFGQIFVIFAVTALFLVPFAVFLLVVVFIQLLLDMDFTESMKAAGRRLGLRPLEEGKPGFRGDVDGVRVLIGPQELLTEHWEAPVARPMVTASLPEPLSFFLRLGRNQHRSLRLGDKTFDRGCLIATDDEVRARLLLASPGLRSDVASFVKRGAWDASSAITRDWVTQRLRGRGTAQRVLEAVARTRSLALAISRAGRRVAELDPPPGASRRSAGRASSCAVIAVPGARSRTWEGAGGSGGSLTHGASASRPKPSWPRSSPGCATREWDSRRGRRPASTSCDGAAWSRAISGRWTGRIRTTLRRGSADAGER